METLRAEIEKHREIVDGTKKYKGVDEVLDDASDKFKLYMGQKRRCRVQHLEFVDTQR